MRGDKVSVTLKFLKRSHEETIFKALFKGRWILFKLIEERALYVRMDDDFARANGYASLQDMKDKEPDVKAQLAKSVKQADGYVWLYWNNGDCFGIDKTKLN